MLAAVALALNVAWELAQRPLYNASGSVPRCLRAAAIDAGWTLAAGAGAALLASRWGRQMFVPLLIALLAIIATGIEALALSTGRWSYAAAMPTLAGLGVAPLVQLPMLGVLAALAAGRTARQRI